MFETPLVRRARPEDLPALADVFRRGWQHGFAGLLAPELLSVDEKSVVDRWRATFDDATVFVAESSTEITGFAWLRDAQDNDATARTLELHMLYTLPGRPAGMALVNTAIEHFEPEFEDITLWSLDTNSPANAFYANRGFEPDGTTKIVSLRGHALPHSRLRRPLTLLNSRARRRPAIRIIPRAPDGSILMMECRNPNLRNPVFWLLPGGMPERNETPAQTVIREFYEETGYQLDSPGREVWKRRHIWYDGPQAWEAVETFFLADLPRFEPDSSGFTDAEKVIVAGFRWWSPKELARTDELIVPAALRSPGALRLNHPIWVGR